jgi:5'-3' exonuclease
MRALIDGDILLYRVGFTTETENEGIAIYRMDELVQRILDTVKATSYNVYLSCGRADSFRAKLNPEYKANRTQPKPLHYQLLKDHLINKWNAIVAVEEEADDLIGIAQAQDKETIACTIDKDILYGVEGAKYNFVKEEMFYTSEQEALVFFYKQLLMGDKADNIFGIKGVGTAKSDRILDGVKEADEATLYAIVVGEYRNWLELEWGDLYGYGWTPHLERKMLDLIHLSGKQLKIRSYEGEIWEPPYGQQDD